MLDLMVPFEEKNSVTINAVTEEGSPLSYENLNRLIHKKIDEGHKTLILNNVCGQRFIGAALSGDLKIYINGVPGNDLGIFMDGPEIFVNGNSEDQAGNTMNDGKIIINGSSGDVSGLSSRGGEIYIKNDVGFRVGIHVKEYKGKMPKIIIGGSCKDYFGEYMAGGMLLILGLDINNKGVKNLSQPITGNCIGSGIHGGVIYIRTDDIAEDLLGIGAKLVEFTDKDKAKIEPLISNFCKYFSVDESFIWEKSFKKIQAASKRPYGSNYCTNLI